MCSLARTKDQKPDQTNRLAVISFCRVTNSTRNLHHHKCVATSLLKCTHRTSTCQLLELAFQTNLPALQCACKTRPALLVFFLFRHLLRSGIAPLPKAPLPCGATVLILGTVPGEHTPTGYRGPYSNEMGLGYCSCYCICVSSC